MWKSRKRKRLDTISEPQRGEVEYFIVSRRKVGLAFAILTIIFVGQGLWLGNLQKSSHQQSVHNRQKFAQTDRVLCASFNRIRADDRATIAAGPKSLAATLRLLRLDHATIVRIVALDAKQVRAELARRPFLKCSKLPSLVATK